MIETLSRRKLIGGFGLLIAAPTIVKIANIMPVKAFGVVDDGYWFNAAEYEALNEASVARAAAYIAQRERFARMLWPAVSKWWGDRLRPDDWQGMFEQKPLLIKPNHLIAQPIG